MYTHVKVQCTCTCTRTFTCNRLLVDIVKEVTQCIGPVGICMNRVVGQK